MKRNTLEHPKVKRLARELRAPRYAAIGILESLWCWAGKYTPAGDVGRYSDEDIADAIGWEGEGAELIRVLVATGWMDECAENRLVIHDWADHADDATKKALSRSDREFAQVVTPVATNPAVVATKTESVAPLSRLPSPALPCPALPSQAAAADAVAPQRVSACWDAAAAEAAKSGARWIKLNADRRKAIQARLRGHPRDDAAELGICAVQGFLVSTKGLEDPTRHLTPETLFRPSNFDKYVELAARSAPRRTAGVNFGRKEQEDLERQLVQGATRVP